MSGKNKYKLSVVIPVYNVEKYVVPCVDSVLKQTLKDIEIIIIDDASTDGTYEVVNRKYGKLSDVTILKNKKNMGQGETRNIGIKRAKGKYIYFMDSDDLLLPWGLASMYMTAEKNKADAVHVNECYQLAFEEMPTEEQLHRHIRRDKSYQPTVCKAYPSVKDRLMNYCVQLGWREMPFTYLYRRNFLLKNNIRFAPMIYEDNVFAYACHAMTDRIWSQSGAFYIYRVRPGSTVTDMSYNRLTKSVAALTVGLRSLQEVLEKAVEPLDEEFKSLVYVSFFGVVNANILPFYKNSVMIEPEVVDAVNKAIAPMFPKDSFVISLLHHYISSNTCQMMAAEGTE